MGEQIFSLCLLTDLLLFYNFQELRGNIRVHCRVRPLMDFDSGGEDSKMLGRLVSYIN